MKVLINWWHKRWLRHIGLTITHERTKIKAEFEASAGVPYLILSWDIHNRSEANVTISEIAGELYLGAWRIGSFEVHQPLEKNPGYSWTPILTITQKNLKKHDGISGVEIMLFPIPEIWFMDSYTCALRNTTINIRSFWGSVVTKNDCENIPIENAQSVASRYLDMVKNRLKPLVR